MSYILLQEGDEGLKWYNSLRITKEEKSLFDIFGKFLGQLESKNKKTAIEWIDFN